MKKFFLIFVFVCALFANDELLLKTANAYKNVIRTNKVQTSKLVELSQAIIIFPKFYKGGFVFGGAGGKGIMLEKVNNTWNASAVSIGGASIGLQIGFESNKLVFFILKKEIVDDIKKAKFIVSAEIAVSAGSSGANVGGKNEVSFTRAMYAYTNNSGLFVGGNLDGSVITQNADTKINTNSYGFKELIKAIGEF